MPEAEYKGKRLLMDIEWQSTKNERMDDRLLGYSHELTRLHGEPVRSVVIYTQPVSDVPQSPLIRTIPCDPLPEGNEAITFRFANMEVCKKSVEELRALDLDAFTVLMVLCKDGRTPAILDEILERLLKNKNERVESIAVTFYFASKVLTSEKDWKFLERKREMLKDIIQDSWLFLKVLEEGREEGREEGFERSIEVMVQARFPDLLTFVKDRLASLADRSKLQEILILVGTARTEEEVRQSLLAPQ